MSKVITILGLILMVVVQAASADTIYLKNGSVIKGRVASYSDDQFVVVLNTGSGSLSSRAQIFSGDVARIEFDASPALTSAPGSTDSGSSVAGPAVKTVVVDTPTRPEPAGTAPTSSQPKDEPTAGAATEPPPVVEKEHNQPPPSDPEPQVARKQKGQVRSATVDVIAKRDWTSSGLIVRRGDTIRITATGMVTLDPGSGQTSGPEGIDQADPKKLMADKATGALIAVIGADNDDFIFIGRSAEFTAARDGLLFLSVNEGTLSDNSGSFKAAIEVESNRR